MLSGQGGTLTVHPLVAHSEHDRHDVYIGSPSKSGNRFEIGRGGDRAQVLARYERWLADQPELLDSLGELAGKLHCRAPLKRWSKPAIAAAVRAWRKETGAWPRSIDWTPSQAAAPERALHREGSYPHASSVCHHYGSWAAALRAAGARGDRRRYTRLAGPRRRYWSAAQVTAAVKRWAVEHGGEPPSYQCWDPAMARRRGRSDTAEVFYRGEWPHASVAIARHGSWSQVLTAAGFQPRPSGGRHTTGAGE